MGIRMKQIALFERGIAPTPIVEMSGDYGKTAIISSGRI